MAQYVHQYVSAMLAGQVSAGKLIGVSVYKIDRQTYAVNLTLLTLLGMVMKKISEVAPQVTDQVWLDALNHALDSDEANPWPVNIVNQIDPEDPPTVEG